MLLSCTDILFTLMTTFSAFPPRWLYIAIALLHHKALINSLMTVYIPCNIYREIFWMQNNLFATSFYNHNYNEEKMWSLIKIPATKTKAWGKPTMDSESVTVGNVISSFKYGKGTSWYDHSWRVFQPYQFRWFSFPYLLSW